MPIFNLKPWVLRGLSTLVLTPTLLVAHAQVQDTQSITTQPMLIRTVPLEVSAYLDTTTLTQAAKTADATFTQLNTTKPLLAHMELIRQAYHTYGSNKTESNKLLKLLKDRYMGEQNNAEKYFDYGYAQLMMEGNKNGLFFLRKANDTLVSPFTSLAYGLAQVDVDRVLDQKPVTELTTRKMDAVYKLKDALVYNKDDLLAGVWPSFVHIVDALKPLPAYQAFVNEDVTTIYVPYGNTFLSRAGGTASQYTAIASDAGHMCKEQERSNKTALPEAQALLAQIAASEGTCNLTPVHTSWATLASSKSFDLNNDGTVESVNFFVDSKPGNPYQVVVMDSKNEMIGQFKTYKNASVIEDVDYDSKYELVVRQYDRDPYHPVYVYRWNGKCYNEDKRVNAYFR